MSVNFNLISAVLTDEDHELNISSVKDIEARLPFALTLPAEEKSSLHGVGAIRVEFTDKTYEYALKNPHLVPSYLDITEFGNDTKLLKQLQVEMDHLVPLVDKLKDTHALVAAETYSAGSIFYHHVRNAAKANVPGASAIAKELAKHFKRVPYKAPKNEAEPTAPADA